MDEFSCISKKEDCYEVSMSPSHQLVLSQLPPSVWSHGEFKKCDSHGIQKDIPQVLYIESY